jgi:phage/plasmid-associated DNA primase
MGRLFYRLNKHDHFQKVLTILGDSATGKSRIIYFFQEAIGQENVSVIGNETETRFGLQSHYESFLCILEEMSRTAKLPVGNWLNMVTGDWVEISKKYEKSESMQWRGNLLIVGNEFAGWLNNQGNVVRRLLILMFTKRPAVVDEHLDEKIKADLPQEILMVTRGYLSRKYFLLVQVYSEHAVQH